jgi:hypothetical protein
MKAYGRTQASKGEALTHITQDQARQYQSIIKNIRPLAPLIWVFLVFSM